MLSNTDHILRLGSKMWWTADAGS